MAAAKKIARKNTMRFQIQWDTPNNGPTFSEAFAAPQSQEISVTEAIQALVKALLKVQPKSAQDAALPAVLKQIEFLMTRPPSGISVQGNSNSAYFTYGRYRDARVDVENLYGTNLRGY